MGVIVLKNIRCYAFHGCLQEEGIIGSDYLVNLTIKADLKKSSQTDDLNDTIDYVKLNEIVVNQMNTRSKLLEEVAQRILNEILNEFEMVHKAKVEVSKINPPLGGDVERVTIKLTQKR